MIITLPAFGKKIEIVWGDDVAELRRQAAYWKEMADKAADLYFQQGPRDLSKALDAQATAYAHAIIDQIAARKKAAGKTKAKRK